MERLIVSLVTCVLLCGAFACLHWFFPRASNAGPWRWLAPYSDSIASARRRSALVDAALRWCQRLLVFVAGGCAAGFLFVGCLHRYLSSGRRPVVPDAAFGYTYLIKGKSDNIYGTYFEYLATSYGVWIAWGGFVLSALLCMRLRVNPNEGLVAYPFLFFVGSAVFMALYFALWQICLHSARPAS